MHDPITWFGFNSNAVLITANGYKLDLLHADSTGPISPNLKISLVPGVPWTNPALHGSIKRPSSLTGTPLAKIGRTNRLWTRGGLDGSRTTPFCKSSHNMALSLV